MIKRKLEWYEDDSQFDKRFHIYAFFTDKVFHSIDNYKEALRYINLSIKQGYCKCNNLIIIDTKNDVKYNYLGKMTDLSLKELKSRGFQADY